MVQRSRNAMTTQPLRRSRESVLVPCWVLVSGPITALAAVSPVRKGTSGRCGGRKEGPQGRKGSVTPLRCVNVGPLSAPNKHRLIGCVYLESDYSFQMFGTSIEISNKI